MEELAKLEFIFDNFIQVPETRNSFAKFLEKDNNLLRFYEEVTTFLKKIQNIKNVTPSQSESVSGQGTSSSHGSNDSPPNTNDTSASVHSVAVSRSSNSSKHRSVGAPNRTTPIFDMYYEVELLLHDYLEPSGKHFIPYFEVNRTSLASAIQERKTKQLEEVDTEIEDAIFYAKAFQDFTQSIYTKLKYDIFPVYIRSESMNNLFKGFKEQERNILLNKVAKQQGVELNKILYTEKEFTEDFIHERDFLFAFQLVHDQSSFWTPVFHVDEKDESRASVYYSTLNFMADNQKSNGIKDLLMLKYTGYLPYNVEDCAKIFYNGKYNNYDPSVLQSEFIQLHLPNKDEEVSKEFLQREVASAITYSELTLGPLLTKRDILVSNAVRYLPHLEEYLLVTKSVTHEQKSDKIKKHIRAKVFVGVSFERIATSETRFTLVTYSQLGGWLKKFGKGWIKMAKQRSKFYVQSFCKIIQEGLQDSKEKSDFLDLPTDITFGYPKVIKWHEENIDRKELKHHYKGFTNKNLFDLKAKKEPTKQIGVRL